MRLYLYGSGHRCAILISLIKNTDIVVEGIIDSNPTKWGGMMEEAIIQAPDCLYNCEDSFVCVTFFGENDCEPIWKELTDKYGINKKRLLSFHDLIRIVYLKIARIPIINEAGNKEWKTIFDGAWEFGLGGVETWIKDTVSELIRRGNSIYILTKGNQVDLDKELQIEFWLSKSCEFTDENVRKSICILMKWLPCVIICSRADEVMLAAYVMKSVYPDYIRLIVVVHGACDGLIRDVFAYDDAVEKYICVSNAAKKALIRLGIKENKCELITAPLHYVFSEKRGYIEKDGGPIRLGYAGRIEIFHKRCDLLLELIRDLEHLKVEYFFEIVGDGSFVPKLINFIAENNLKKKVVYSGIIKRKDIFKFWQEKDIAINISDSEGRPISNIEAMFCGAVPVVTATAGILDDVEDNITGYTVDVGDHEAMAAQIDYLDKNRHLLKLIGEKAQENIRKKTDVELYVKKWMDILSAL